MPERLTPGLSPRVKPSSAAPFAVQALSGFGASAVTPMLFGFVLDLGGGSGREAAWIAAFAMQAALGASWPLVYL
jgi:hypothetical protein